MTVGWSINYGSQPMYAVAVSASTNTPLNLEPADQDWIHVDLQWQSPEDDACAIELKTSLGQDIARFSSLHKSTVAYRFMNDAHEGQRVLSSYGEKNFNKLLAISRSYDPQRIFQTLQHGGWLLSKEL
ncbi:hypothetical protein F5Y01DRAFT_317206 [Xylaria sp. FL0043]|nr:hypothetical protein F5Y01DRAFT_317206 [Xylaria sp. FL0043]